MPFILAGGAVGSALVGGLISDQGQRSANRANLKIAREQMAFQERMSNTAYQRAASDLELAGLNRVLALGSPASTPTGASATMLNTRAGRGAAVGQAVNTALAARQASAAIAQTEAQTKNINQDTANKSLQHMIMTHGETVASVAADVVRVVRSLMGNKSPDEVAGIIKDQIEKASGALTNALEAMSNSTTSVGAQLQSVKDDITTFVLDAIEGAPIPRTIDAVRNVKEYDRLRKQGYSHEAAESATRPFKK